MIMIMIDGFERLPADAAPPFFNFIPPSIPANNIYNDGNWGNSFYHYCRGVHKALESYL